MSVADTILAQLGGSKFLAMTGAHTLLSDERALRFRIPTSAQRINFVSVWLGPGDTYDMLFYRISNNGLEFQQIKEVRGLGTGDLRTVFTETTGRAVSL